MLARRRTCRFRFIPARAGNTYTHWRLSVPGSVYPRSRGEHSKRCPHCGQLTGLSPLARGTLRPISHGTRPPRFIPARAGNTAEIQLRLAAVPVYPRSRGEHFLCTSSWINRCGLSPLARGTRECPLNDKQRVRFIPARAGNTERPDDRSGYAAVYPRSRGEHKNWLPAILIFLGLSPLARGTRAPSGDDHNIARFIPARAGNTVFACACRIRLSVYPRSRGEHTVNGQAGRDDIGLSPLARGTL